MDEDFVRLLLDGDETALTLEIVRTLTPDDVCTLFAALREGFSQHQLAHLLELVAEQIVSRSQPSQAELEKETP